MIDNPDNTEIIHTPAELYRWLRSRFLLAELQSVALDLEIDSLNPQNGRNMFARELVEYCHRHNKIDQLTTILKNDRPSDKIDVNIPAKPGSGEDLLLILKTRFDAGEIELMSFTLGIDYETLSGDNKNLKILALLKLLTRHGRLKDIVDYGKRHRDDIDWDTIKLSTAPLEKEEKNMTQTQHDSIPISRRGVLGRSTAFNTQNFQINIKQIVENLSSTKPEEIQKVAASQIELISSFYTLVLSQARRSFLWAIVAATSGMMFFIGAVGLLLIQESFDAASITVIGGVIAEFIAGIYFYLYNKSHIQLSEFHNRLEMTQRFLLGNSMCERLEGDFKQYARADLVRVMIGGMPSSALPKANGESKEPLEENNPKEQI